MQKSQLLGKYVMDQITALKVINNNLNDYLVKSKCGKVLQTALYQQNYVVFLSSKRGVGVRPRNLPPGCATGNKGLTHKSEVTFETQGAPNNLTFF